MRILIANKFMYPRGGDCVVALLTSELLRQHGHEVRVFAMDYPDNLPLPDASGYASRVSFDGSAKDRLKAFLRLMGWGDIRKSFRKVMDDFRPDIVHLHNIHSYLSPAIGEMAAKMGAKVVWTQHDYKLICPAYSCRRPDGTNCEACFSGKTEVAKHRCMKGSYPASIIAAMEAGRWSRRRLERFADVFICPSLFMGKCLVKAGFKADKVRILSNFADPAKFEGIRPNLNPKHYFCYVGRLSPEKGVETMVEAASKAGVNLKIAGDGPLKDELAVKYGRHGNIEFMGRLDAGDVAELLRDAMASVMPSECYENNPLGVIESLCLGTPVIGAGIGGIPELLVGKDGEAHRGRIFHSGDARELVAAFKSFNPALYDRKMIAESARKQFAPQRHYEALMKIYGLG